MSEQTATGRLRELLDERGVEWWYGIGEKSTVYDGEHDVRYEVDGTLGLLFIRSALDVTPEQAIAATLGNDGVGRSNDGVERSSDGVAERGTCHDTGGTDENDQQVFNCDACGCVLSLYHRDGINTMCTHYIYDYPRFCPCCGREVVPE